MMYQKAFKYRIYPTAEQADQLNKFMGCARFVYNLGLETRQEAFDCWAERGGSVYDKSRCSLSAYDLCKQLTVLKQWDGADFLREAPIVCLQQSLLNMDKAYKSFFSGIGKYPRFKGKRGTQSCIFPNGYRIIESRLLKVPKIDVPVRIVMHRNIQGEPKTLTISRTSTGKYYAAFQCKVDAELPTAPRPCRAIGVDLNVSTYDYSDGKVSELPKPLKKAAKRLRFLQRQLSKKKKGSENYKKAAKKVALLHEHVASIRRDWLHNETAALMRSDYDTICIEDLNNAGMQRKPKAKLAEDGKTYERNNAAAKAGLTKGLVDAAFGEYARQLQYKAVWYGKNILKAPRFEPTSKKCNHCGWKNTELKLKDREWTCGGCGALNNRDLNAAKNIRDVAMANQK